MTGSVSDWRLRMRESPKSKYRHQKQRALWRFGRRTAPALVGQPLCRRWGVAESSVHCGGKTQSPGPRREKIRHPAILCGWLGCRSPQKHLRCAPEKKRVEFFSTAQKIRLRGSWTRVQQREYPQGAAHPHLSFFSSLDITNRPPQPNRRNGCLVCVSPLIAIVQRHGRMRISINGLVPSSLLQICRGPLAGQSSSIRGWDEVFSFTG